MKTAGRYKNLRGNKIMADDEQDVWEQAAKTYKGGTAPSSTPPQASSNQDSSSQASPSNDPWEKAAKTFKANPSQEIGRASCRERV